MSYKENLKIPTTDKYIDEHQIKIINTREDFLNLIDLTSEVKSSEICYANVSLLKYNASGDNSHDRNPYVTTGEHIKYLTLLKGKKNPDKYVVDINMFKEDEIKSLVYFLNNNNFFQENLDNKIDILKLYNPSLESKKLVKSDIRKQWEEMISLMLEKKNNEIKKEREYNDFMGKLKNFKDGYNYLTTKKESKCLIMIKLPNKEELHSLNKILYDKIFKDNQVIEIKLKYEAYEKLSKEINSLINKIKYFEYSLSSIKDLREEIIKLKSRMLKEDPKSSLQLDNYKLYSYSSEIYKLELYTKTSMIKTFDNDETFFGKEIKSGETYKIKYEEITKEDFEKKNYNLEDLIEKIDKDIYIKPSKLKRNVEQQIEGNYKKISEIKTGNTITVENIKKFYDVFIKNKDISLTNVLKSDLNLS